MINLDELFKNHQASRVDCGQLSIITYKKPDSFEHGLRYIFDNELSTLTITGDWLKAVAVNVNNMGSPDRLYESAYEPRFGFNYIKRICDFHDVQIIIVSEEIDHKSDSEELAEDIIALIHSFSSKLYGLRHKIKESIDD